MTIIDTILQQPAWFYTVVVLVSLAVGSFLNVVIYRYPLILDRQWRTECVAYLSEHETNPETVGQPHPHETFNLAYPASRCPHCGHRIRAIENIPVISFLVLGGRCAECRQRIALRYPLVEILAAALSVVIAASFGPTWQTLFALILTWTLIALSFIDYDHQLLPDNIIYPVLWLGILVNVGSLYTSLQAAVLGAVAGYLSLWIIFKLFKLLTGKEGMGYGDFKLLALLGAWLGWQSLPLVIILSALVGAVLGIGMIAVLGRDRHLPIPFGPYLAMAGWIALLWGEDITRFYLKWAGIA